jgi:omega-6 fatty acid desaturase (delta-12 desaturase)
VLTLTVGEYRARSWRGRLGYRLIRNPLVMFGLGPVIAMIAGPRLPARGVRPRMRNSVLATDLALAAIVGALCWLIGWNSGKLLTFGQARAAYAKSALASGEPRFSNTSL